MSPSSNTPGWKHLAILLVLITATATLVAGVEVRFAAEAGVKEVLPDQLGENWSGDEVLFCHSPTCGRDWLTREVSAEGDAAPRCPMDWRGNPCDGKLYTMSLGEQMILGSDTVILKKRYQHRTDPERTVFCSMVFSGERRNSIHRPETCMVGQGHTILNGTIIDVPLEGREPLQVMVLHLSKKLRPGVNHTSYYAYWFVGKGRETPFHHERMVWMSLDRIFRNISHRWAYISVSGVRDPDISNTDHYAEIREVIGDLYPLISLQGSGS